MAWGGNSRNTIEFQGIPKESVGIPKDRPGAPLRRLRWSREIMHYLPGPISSWEANPVTCASLRNRSKSAEGIVANSWFRRVRGKAMAWGGISRNSIEFQGGGILTQYPEWWDL